MLSNYLPIPDIHDAPPIVQRLRQAFDEKLEELHAMALQVQSRHRHPETTMIHIPFAFEQLDVEAMYDTEQELFTQLVARPLSDNANGLRTYTISLFLVGRTEIDTNMTEDPPSKR